MVTGNHESCWYLSLLMLWVALALRASCDDPGCRVRSPRRHRLGSCPEELCQAGFTSYFAYPVLAPRTYVSPSFQGTLGCELMTALGVKAAHPDRPVVCMTGDRGLMFGISELASAVQYGIGVITVLFNNGAYGNVLRDQQVGFAGRLIGSELRNPDFQLLAASFGIDSWRAETEADLERTLSDALAANRPALIEVMVDRAAEVSPWNFIHLKM